MRKIELKGALLAALAAVLLLTVSINARATEPVANGSVFNADSSASITIEQPHSFAPVFLDSDVYTSQFTLTVKPEDRGRLAAVLLGGLHNSEWFVRTESGWQPWDRTIQTVPNLGYTILQESLTVDVFTDDFLPPGNFEIYAAYQVLGQEPEISPEPLRFTVKPATDDTLHPFLSDASMAEFLKQGLNRSASNKVYALDSLATTSSAEAGDDSAGSRVSATNLQEAGVDEADSIKTDGEHLFTLRDCAGKSCLVTYELDADEALAAELSNTELSGALQAESMYLVQGEAAGDQLVVLGSQSNNYRWFDVWGWSGNRTEMEFFDASDPANLVSTETLGLDGQLISSRRVGNKLYVVTRFTPYLEGYLPYAYEEKSVVENAQLLESTSLYDLVPKVTDSSGQARPLVDSSKCYLPTRSVDRNASPTIITLTTIDLDAPGDYESVCFGGDTEAIYMTPESLYLATTQYNYDFIRPNVLFYNPEHTTAIHKFSLQAEGIEYRGSGQVRGHLGWSEDKKSFRLGENGDYLNVVTSVGDTWNQSSSTRLTVLKEADLEGRLQEVNVIDGIGKPGEQLYAARFFGNTGYLVTFRLTDPLYVLDLSDQENPLIAGELEIDGYSDYLHPVAEGLLLGIGKDAIADEISDDFGGNRGAWYQGVKLSLFDVSDPANPGELSSIVLGKRGTNSAVLYDHHALSFLPATDDQPARLAIPVDLHDTAPVAPWFDPDSPSAWYDYTHTGLYSFEISDDAIEQVGIIYGTQPGSNYYYSNYGDRSVLIDDAVFYVHSGEVISSFWGAGP